MGFYIVAIQPHDEERLVDVNMWPKDWKLRFQMVDSKTIDIRDRAINSLTFQSRGPCHTNTTPALQKKHFQRWMSDVQRLDRFVPF